MSLDEIKFSIIIIIIWKYYVWNNGIYYIKITSNVFITLVYLLLIVIIQLYWLNDGKIKHVAWWEINITRY